MKRRIMRFLIKVVTVGQSKFRTLRKAHMQVDRNSFIVTGLPAFVAP